MPITVRSLLESDIRAANAILSSAFQRDESWNRELSLFRSLQPDGIFLACQGSLPAGMVGTILYPDYAYVGLMGVHRDFQRQGIGMALMQHVLARMHEQGVPVVRLDASPFGQPLYEKLGFIPFEEVFVLQRQRREVDHLPPPEVQSLTPQNLDLMSASDTQAFGTNRMRLLQALLGTYPGRAWMLPGERGWAGGYLFAQEKRIGPWVMFNGADPAPLLQAALAVPFPGAVSVIVPAENPGTIALLQRDGFAIVRANRHMAYGANAPAGRRRLIFGQTSLSMG